MRRSMISAAERRRFVGGGGVPNGAYWIGDMRGNAQDFSAFDGHDMHLDESIVDPTFGTTTGATIVPVPGGAYPGGIYPASQYMMRLVISNSFGSSSLSGAVTVPWMGGGYGAYLHPWVQRGQHTWFRTLFLLPDGTDPNYPGALVPVNGDGVSAPFHIVAEWHQNDDWLRTHGGVGGPTSSKCEIYKNTGAFGTSFLFKPLGGLVGSYAGYYMLLTNAVQTKANSIAGSFTGTPNGTVQQLQFNHWYDMLWYMELDPNPAVGYCQWWVDGVKRFDDHLGTMIEAGDHTVPGVGWETGMYRGGASSSGGGTQTNQFNEIMYQGPMLAGPTALSVGASYT